MDDAEVGVLLGILLIIGLIVYFIITSSPIGGFLSWGIIMVTPHHSERWIGGEKA